jgi:hypothetical protein
MKIHWMRTTDEKNRPNRPYVITTVLTEFEAALILDSMSGLPAEANWESGMGKLRRAISEVAEGVNFGQIG